MARSFYTQNGWEGSNYDRNLSIKDITAKIREYLKKEFPDCKFSVTKDGGTYTDSVNICLMEAPENVIKSERANIQLGGHISERDDLTEYGVNVMKNVANYANAFNYNDSDGMIDYFDTNFYLKMEVGKWDKPFKIVEKKTEKVKQGIPVSGVQIVDYSEKAIAIVGETKEIKDKLKELGGRFNFRLSCGAGWIFSKKQENQVRAALSL